MTQSTPDKKGLLMPRACLCLGGEPSEPTGPSQMETPCCGKPYIHSQDPVSVPTLEGPESRTQSRQYLPIFQAFL